VFGAILLDMLAVIFGGATALLPQYADEVLGGGPELMGILRASPYVGALLMAGWLAFRPDFRRAGPARSRARPSRSGSRPRRGSRSSRSRSPARRTT
jgi:hypothetical protein